MANIGDIAIIHYNSDGTDSFSFVFLNPVAAGTTINFTDNGWQAGGGFRPGEGTVTYTAATDIAAGTVVTLSGLDLDEAGDQIIAYEGDPASPSILYVVDLGDGNTTVAGDATDANTTALPPGFTLGLNAVAVGFDTAIYAGPTSGEPAELFAAVSGPANWINSDRLATLFDVFFRPDIDLDANNSTHGGRDYRASITSGGPAVKIADSDIVIDDQDGTLIFAAEIHIRGTDLGDELSVNAALLPPGISASLYDPLTGVLILSGAASHADYEAAIQLIEFSTTQPVDRQKKIEVSVFDGEEWGREAQAFITVASVAAPPVLDLDANNSNGGGADYTATFTSGGPASPVADIDVSITDADSAAIISATITLGINRQDEDELSFTGPAGPITAAYDSAAGILTLTGSATLAEYQTALRQVVFNTTSTSTADRIIQVTVNDGTLDSNVGTTYMHVVVPPPNVPPINTVPGAQSVAEDTILPIAGVSVADIDSSALTTTLKVLSGTLNVIDGAGAVVTGNGSASVTIAGTAAEINAALVGLAYTGNLDFNGGDTLTVATSDATSTDTDTIAITVNPVNDAPINTVPGAQSVAEDTILPIAGVSVADIDSSALTTTLNVSSGKLNVIDGAGAVVTGNSSASVTIAGTAAQINAALAGLAYTGNLDFNGADTLTVATSDATSTDTDTIAITVKPVNDAPALVVADATYLENAAPVLLSPSASLTDADAELTSAAVQITAGSFPGDGDTLTIGGATSGTVTGIAFLWDPTLLALELTGASSPANYQALLQTVAFQSTSDNPTDFNASPQRTLTWFVSDGTAVTTATTTLDITAENDAPLETVAASAAYTENASPVTVSPAATASDADDINLVYGVVQIYGWVDGDVLTVNGQQSGTFAGIDFSYDAASHKLVFSHPAPVADFQALMQAVQFGSTSENPTDFGANPTRRLSWGLHDGDDYSYPAQITQIVINALDDPAVAQNDAVPTTEDTVITAGNVFANNGFGVDSDPDGGTFLVTAVSGGTLGAPFALPSGALLTLNADGTFSYDPNHMFDYLPTPGSGASNLTVTDTFTYTITGGDTATVTVTVHGVDTDDTLLDSPGIDTLAGGIGNDIYYVNNTADVVIEAANAGFDAVVATVNYTLPANNTVEILNMLGSELTGTGSDGAESLVSIGGPNTLVGLGGNDSYTVGNTDDEVIEAANAGSDAVIATVNYTLPANVEALYMDGSGLTGTGSDGAETLVSTGGPNTLVGLGGNDVYYVNNTADVVIEAENAGFDAVIATVNYTLPANNTVEILNMLGSELTGTGSDGAESLVSIGGPNTLVGLGGNDSYTVNNTDDEVIEAANAGSDAVIATVNYILPANVEALYMNGSGLTGTGSSGADTLFTLGANTLVGGDDNDTFVFSAGSANGATVADFDGNQVDEEDFLVFSGFGTQAQGATFSPIVGTDQWQIHSGLDGHNETITFSNAAATFSNAAAPQVGDFLFV